MVRPSQKAPPPESRCERMIRKLICSLTLAVMASLGCGRSAEPAAAENPAVQTQSAGAQDPPTPANAANFAPPAKVDSGRAMEYLRRIVAMGRRAPGSAGHARLQRYLRQQLAKDELVEDDFTANSPAGKFKLTNLIARFPGTEDGVIVIASHYDTAYAIKDFVGANDGGSSTALLLELANQLRTGNKQRPSVWLVWFDGEEAFKSWTDEDSLYGSRHLAEKWQKDGTLKKIKALILTDMIGDAELNIERDANSTPWLQDLVYKAATTLGYQSYFFGQENQISDDHLPFVLRSVPSVDLIDLNYGYKTAEHPNGMYWHTPQDTIDKISPKSLQVVGDTVLETIRLLSMQQPR